MAPAFLVFLFVYVFSFFFVMGFNDWFMVWCGLEMNMMSFLSMVYSRGDKSSIISVFKYFFIQSLASGLFLVMMYVGGSIVYVMSVKLAAGPFYFWLPGVMEGLGWMECFFLISIQKLLPLFLLSGSISNSLWFIALISLLVGMFGSYGQSSLSSLMAYSSVGHLGWLIMGIYFDVAWIFYYMCYVFVLFPLIYFFYMLNVNIISSEMNKWPLFMVLSMLSIAGMPPLLGFSMKWIMLYWMVSVDIFSSFIMIVTSLVMFYIYVRVVFDCVMGGGGWLVVMKEEGFIYTSIITVVVLGLFVFPIFVWKFM